MADIRKPIANIIKNRRKQFKMTQSDLANLVGVEPKYISRIETAVSYPSLAVLERIFDSLKIRINDVLEQENDINRETTLALLNSNLKHASNKHLKLFNEIIEAIIPQ